MTNNKNGFSAKAAITAFILTFLLGSSIGGFVAYSVIGAVMTSLHLDIKDNDLGLYTVLMLFILCVVFFWFTYRLMKVFLSKK